MKSRLHGSMKMKKMQNSRLMPLVIHVEYSSFFKEIYPTADTIIVSPSDCEGKTSAVFHVS